MNPEGEFEGIYEIINDAARAYRGVIPANRWRDLMPREELRHEIHEGVVFWGYEEEGRLLGVMGLQQVQDATLIRHSYVRTARRNLGIGGKLLSHLKAETDRPLLVGTWATIVGRFGFMKSTGSAWYLPGRKIGCSKNIGPSRTARLKPR